jgi:photosystem II stability/assembly factor-like uncharacterized protein
MRRSTISAAVSMCLPVLLTVVLCGPVAASGVTPSASAIPTGFRAQSLTWASPKQGWMLGVAPCGESTCTTVVGTTDGGRTWNTIGTLNAPLTLEEETGVTEMRFADALHGWAFWPALWATRDGGVTWKRQKPPGDGRQVLALAGDSDAVYAVVSPCRLNHPCNDPVMLWRTTAGSSTWTQVSLTLPVATSAVLAVHGVVAYLVAPVFSFDGVLAATTDGHQWSSRPNPCIKAHDETLWDVAPVSDTQVALVCVSDPGFSQAGKRVLRSNDTGQTTSPAGNTPRDGIVSLIAAAPNGTLVVSSWGAAGSWIYRNSGGRSWTTPVALADAGEGWNAIVFTTNKVGFVIYGPAGVYPGNRIGQLWETQDGGVTWAPV